MSTSDRNFLVSLGLMTRVRDRHCVTARGWWRRTGSTTVSTRRRWPCLGSPFTSRLPTPRRNLAPTRYTNSLFMYFSSWCLRLCFPWIPFACHKRRFKKKMFWFPLQYVELCSDFVLCNMKYCYIISIFKSVKIY